MKLTFLGATQTVTGSKYLLSDQHQHSLIDCGLFQGYKELRLRNWNAPPFNPEKIHNVVLTHAHIDHSGYLPLLAKQGFSGKIYCSESTHDLCQLLLLDSAHLQEEEARLANLYGFSKHKPALPLYTKEDAERALELFHPMPFGTEFAIQQNIVVSLHHAGHIPGASFVLVKNNDTTLLFSGDLGRPHDPVMRAPAQMEGADYLVLESTYGNRLHEKVDPLAELANVINKTAKRGGSIIVPAFAVGRAQSILYFLYQLKQAEKIPNLPIFLDSPMAISATELFVRHANENRFSHTIAREVANIANYVKTPEESAELDVNKMPKIIISASGMATGGRILQHLMAYAPEPRNTILFTGYQAGGTRGDRIIKGEKVVKMHGQMVEINAEIISLDYLSAHADYAETLDWLAHFKKVPKKVFITHGEPEAALSLQEKITIQFGWNCEIPKYLREEEI